MENPIFYPAAKRINANHGWVNSYFTFVPNQASFGALVALNEDTIQAGQGFGMHPHQNMEIITIPLEGELEHQDTVGNKGITQKGDVQVMSAGTRIAHSEYNHSKSNPLRLLQIWVRPNQQNVPPRYGQMSFNQNQAHNQLVQIVSPNAEQQPTWIHQNAWFHLGHFDAGQAVTYSVKQPGNGVYTFVIKGQVQANGKPLGINDGLGISGASQIAYTFESAAEVLIIEVPMN